MIFKEAKKIRVFIEAEDGTQFMADINPQLEHLIMAIIATPDGAIKGRVCSLNINDTSDIKEVKNKFDKKPFPKEYRIPLYTEVFTIPCEKHPCTSKGIVSRSAHLMDGFMNMVSDASGVRICDLPSEFLYPVHPEEHPFNPNFRHR